MRNPTNSGHLSSLGVELIPGDLNNTAALHQLAENCAIIVHGAGAVRGNAQEDFDAVNIDGTANLLQALSSLSAPPRLIHLSSLAAREPELSYYAHSKRGGEALLHEHPELSWVALRPPAVYGPGDKEMLPIFRTMKMGFATVPGALEARISLIHVDDVVTAILAAATAPDAQHQVFELGDGTPGGYSWAEMAAIAGESFGCKVRLWQVPRALLNAVAGLNSLLASITGRAPMLTPPKLRELRHPDWVTNTAAITAATGWAPTITLGAGIQALDL